MRRDAAVSGRVKLVVDELLNHAPCGFFSFGEDGIIQQVNATLLDMLGYPREEVERQHVEKILTVGSRIFYQTHWFPLLRLHGHAEEIFLMLRSRAGEDMGVIVNAARRSRAGRAAFDCVLIRVRERQKFEEELLRARRVAEQARAEAEAQQQELQDANELLEAQAEELQLQQQQLQEQAAELEAASDELTQVNQELLARTREAEHLRMVAEEANHAKSAFLAVMSHELRTPLNAIAGYVEILEMGIPGPVTEGQREALRKIARSERHLLRLVNEVLNLSRIEAGLVEYDLTDIGVDELVAAVTPMVEPQLARKAVRFEVDVPTESRVRVDAEKAPQVLLNLLGNAVKFTPPGGRVSVTAGPMDGRPGHLAIRVTDTGIGIDPDKLEAIFQPFVQVDASRTRTAEGTGLGLAISRDLARGMNGDLVVESTPGTGSTFGLVLPLAKDP